ncbi:hypothetical protein G6F68_012151 [Rhizopus microsporus]|nr:hypothetical protein G6F68_012151 [Rhizopus microsporus]
MPSPRLRHEAIFLLVFALDLVNMFIATVAYPALAAELHADVGTLAWVGTAYMLGLSVVIPLAPTAAVRGRRCAGGSRAGYRLAAGVAPAAGPGRWPADSGGPGGGLPAVHARPTWRADPAHPAGGAAGAGTGASAGRAAGAMAVLARCALGQPAAGTHGDWAGAGVDARRRPSYCAAPAGPCAVHRDDGAGRAAAGVDLAGRTRASSCRQRLADGRGGARRDPPAACTSAATASAALVAAVPSQPAPGDAGVSGGAGPPRASAH